MAKKYALIWKVVLCCFMGYTVCGQVYHSEFLRLDQKWGSTTNPAFDLRDRHDTIRFKIEFANVAGAIASLGVSFGDFLINKGNGVYALNTQNLIDDLNPTNKIRVAATIGTFATAWQNEKWMVNLAHAIRFNGQLTYPKELIDIFANGNAQFIAQRVDIGIAMISNAYNEYSIGLSYGRDRWRIGGKVKYLSGIQDVSTTRNKISFLTREDVYQLDFENDFQINTSNLLEYNNIGDVSLNFNSQNSFFWTQNNGIAIDLGLEFQISDKMSVDLSIIDKGSIKWEDKVTNYISEGSYTYEGIDLVDYLKGDLDAGFIDSLETLLRTDETNTAYETDLPFHGQLGLQYKLNQITSINFMGKFMKFQDNELISLGGHIHSRISKVFTFGASYIYTAQNPINIGLAAKLRLGIFEMHLAQENVLFFLKKNYTRTKFGFAFLF